MISGWFRNGHPRLEITLETSEGPLTISCIIDTGFEGGIALPARIARQTGADVLGVTDRALANGSIVKVPIMEVVVLWDGERRDTELLVMEGNALLGTEFLSDHLLTVEMAPGGEVSVEPL